MKTLNMPAQQVYSNSRHPKAAKITLKHHATSMKLQSRSTCRKTRSTNSFTSDTIGSDDNIVCRSQFIHLKSHRNSALLNGGNILMRFQLMEKSLSSMRVIACSCLPTRAQSITSDTARRDRQRCQFEWFRAPSNLLATLTLAIALTGK